MPKGGSRVRSGPTPDPNALRRDRDQASWIDLPAEGRQGPTPDWPLTRPTKRELELWDTEWQRPQAVMWEQNGVVLEVALYVRQIRIAESPSATNSARTLLRQMMDGLGVSQSGMARLRWRIHGGGPAATAKTTAARPGSARDRLKVVDGSA